jgi:hypothetical protein
MSHEDNFYYFQLSLCAKAPRKKKFNCLPIECPVRHFLLHSTAASLRCQTLSTRSGSRPFASRGQRNAQAAIK